MAASKFKNLNIYGDITSLKVIESKAFINFVFISTEKVNPSKSFRLFLKENEQLTPATGLTYWVNKKNILYGEQQNISEEVNVNTRYEETINFDISDNGYAELIDLRWKRVVQLVVLDATTEEQVWTSQKLNVLSEQITLPKIPYIKLEALSVDLEDDDSLEEVNCEVGIKYPSGTNYIYVESRLIYELKLIDTFSKKEIASIQIKRDASQDHIAERIFLDYNFSGLKLTAPVTFVLNLKLESGLSLFVLKKTFVPIKPKNKLFVKQNGLVKKVTAIYTNKLTGQNAVNNNAFYYNEEGLYISE